MGGNWHDNPYPVALNPAPDFAGVTAPQFLQTVK
jgi:hypothetical protein